MSQSTGGDQPYTKALSTLSSVELTTRWMVRTQLFD
jgi:hypothetical protein